MGAAYVMTGSVNQACVESGLSAQGRTLLAGVGLADVIMAPAADMFELGVNLQVLKRGTLFGPRAKKLYELYVSNSGLRAIVGEPRRDLEKMFGQSVEEVWSETRQFWLGRDPAVVELAARDPKYQMALVFRWYLGKSSRWAIEGAANRTLDYQISCGPAMGAFNSWVRNSFLEAPERREVVQVALNLLEGAAQITRAQQARTCGVPVPTNAFRYKPRPLAVDQSYELSRQSQQRRWLSNMSKRPPIAVVGVSAVSGSVDAEHFWRNITEGVDLLSEVPESHWRISDYYDPGLDTPDKMYATRGGFLPYVDFAPTDFGILRRAAATDTAQLLALAVAKQVLEDAAGGDFSQMDRERISVVLGVASATEMVAHMSGRLQAPVWERALRGAGIAGDQLEAFKERIAAAYTPWQENTFPGCWTTWSPDASPTGSTSAEPLRRRRRLRELARRRRNSAQRPVSRQLGHGHHRRGGRLTTSSCSCASARSPRCCCWRTAGRSPTRRTGRCSAKGWR